ncbi:Vps52-domain-containing protein [Trichoderma longibrachiatum ATCC 18648]|uniref:Vps52-domain-containing protein n=1 Tax=Trichoderma longibrachiatum ATCC 18648 TaxID=983965 RepID=A0A2T4BUH7_TRILO|nr:Vps52-domain-containing protein [Trichoderma longibrachiatum ATCC 18648]
MWLDRLSAPQANASGPSTPQLTSRHNSPLPRRTSSNLSPYITSQRQGPSPRGSSLSLVSGDSTTSLLASSRKPNGSETRQNPTGQGPDPVDVLEKLLAADSEVVGKTQSRASLITQEDLALDFDFGGLSLQELAAAESGQNATSLRRPQSASEYEQDKARFDALHRSIVACDDILNSVENNLTDFRNDLSTVSADIETLQSRSSALSRRLENRKRIEKALGPLVEELSVSPDTISRITTGHIDEAWAKTLNEVDKRAAAIKKLSGTQQGKASEELGPILEKLILKAIERIRDFLVAQIKALRSPHINAQIIQQQNFLRFKDLYTFLHKHHAALAEEISQAYMNTMRWYYLNQFTRYERALAKLKLHVLDKNDVLGQEDATRKTAVLSSSRVAGPPHDAFNLGSRIDMLRTKSTSAISSYLAEEDQSTHYLEVPFRNFNLALIDNATAEYTFLAAFFAPALSYAQISRNFNYIFEPTFDVGRALSKTLVSESFDALGLLLCIRLNQHFAFDLQRRKVPAVDGYINGTNMLLWPRLQVIMDRHCESVRLLTNAAPTKLAKADQSKMSAAPHMVTQRFGQLLQGFLALSTEAGDDEPVVASLRRLRAEVEAFLARHAQTHGEARKSERFLYNNYSLILTIIGDETGKLAEEQQRHFEELKQKYQGEA